LVGRFIAAQKVDWAQPDGPIAVTASALFIIVPMSHFLEKAPKEYIEHVKKHPELLAFVDPEFEINP
jgi:hypothetical protein